MRRRIDHDRQNRLKTCSPTDNLIQFYIAISAVNNAISKYDSDGETYLPKSIQ